MARLLINTPFFSNVCDFALSLIYFFVWFQVGQRRTALRWWLLGRERANVVVGGAAEVRLHAEPCNWIHVNYGTNALLTIHGRRNPLL